jgi:Na+/proline symporter
MNKSGNILEVIWFVMGGFLLFIGITEALDTGLGDSWYYLVFALLSLFMYLRRRRIRLSNK